MRLTCTGKLIQNSLWRTVRKVSTNNSQIVSLRAIEIASANAQNLGFASVAPRHECSATIPLGVSLN